MELFTTLADCGVASSDAGGNIVTHFPYVLVGQWGTKRRGAPIAPSPFAYQAEMDAVANSPDGTPLEMATASNLEPLKNSPFIITKLEFFAFDKNGEMLPNWQPNGFNPKFVINNHNLLSNLEDPEHRATPGMAQVGLPLPYCLEFLTPFNPMQSVEVEAPLRRLVAGVVKNYPVVCFATFRYRK